MQAPNTGMEYYAFAIFALMIGQHIAITRSTTNSADFHRSWRHYRWHINFCNIFAFTAFTIVAVLLLVDWGVALDETRFRKHLYTVLATRGYVSLTLFALFLACINIIVERHLHAYLLRRNPGLRDPWQKDVWLLWFVLSVLASLSIEAFTSIEASAPESPALNTFVALAVAVAILLTYVTWIHSVLYRQLTIGDGFPASIIPPLHRRITPLDPYPPAQALVIGPRAAGKSLLISKCDTSYGERTAGKNAPQLGTQIVQEATMMQRVPVANASGGKTNEMVRFSLLDFPGENIGDHCTLPLDLRCDVLVLVIAEEALNPELENDPTVITIQKSQDIDRYFRRTHAGDGDPEPAIRSRDYLYALYFGLNYDPASPALAGRDRSAVGSFVLTINGRELAPRYDTDHFNRHIKRLAEQLGHKFGAPPERCFAECVNVTGINAAIFVNALAQCRGFTARTSKTA